MSNPPVNIPLLQLTSSAPIEVERRGGFVKAKPRGGFQLEKARATKSTPRYSTSAHVSKTDNILPEEKERAPPPRPKLSKLKDSLHFHSSKTVLKVKDFMKTPQVIILNKFLFSNPARYITFIILFCYLLGYFGFSFLWCLVITAAVNSTMKVMLKRKLKRSVQLKKRKFYLKENVSSDEESCEWMNDILQAVYGNHNKYISHLFVRFANPLLQKLCTPPPIEFVEFRVLNIGPSAPQLSGVNVIYDIRASAIKFYFTVHYTSSFNGIVHSRLNYSAKDIPVFISNLKFKAKMQFDVGFTKEKFPFLSSLGWSFLEPPEIDISVKAGGLVEIASITEHYVDLVAKEMYNRIGNPRMVSKDFTPFIPIGSLDVQTNVLIERLQKLVPLMIKHGELASLVAAPTDQLDPNFPYLGKISHINNFKSKIVDRTKNYLQKQPSPSVTRSEDRLAPASIPVIIIDAEPQERKAFVPASKPVLKRSNSDRGSRTLLDLPPVLQDSNESNSDAILRESADSTSSLAEEVDSLILSIRKKRARSRTWEGGSPPVLPAKESSPTVANSNPNIKSPSVQALEAHLHVNHVGSTLSADVIIEDKKKSKRLGKIKERARSLLKKKTQ